MDDTKLFSAVLEDKLTQCKNDCLITYTRFLDLRQQDMFLSYPKDKSVVPILFGGYESAERKIGVFLPKLYGICDERDFSGYDSGEPLKAVRIEKDKFSSLTHRDYLGAIMSLGIKRETVGDILPDENGANVILFKEIVPHIIQNLDRIGRGSCKCTEIPLSELEKVESETVEVFATVASLRLDNIVSTAFSISRKLAVQGILQKKVFVDGSLCEKADRKVSVGSKIVFQGKGKAVLLEQNGLSKKDRPKIVIKRYI